MDKIEQKKQRISRIVDPTDNKDSFYKGKNGNGLPSPFNGKTVKYVMSHVPINEHSIKILQKDDKIYLVNFGTRIPLDDIKRALDFTIQHFEGLFSDYLFIDKECKGELVRYYNHLQQIEDNRHFNLERAIEHTIHNKFVAVVLDNLDKQRKKQGLGLFGEAKVGDSYQHACTSEDPYTKIIYLYTNPHIQWFNLEGHSQEYLYKYLGSTITHEEFHSLFDSNSIVISGFGNKDDSHHNIIIRDRNNNLCFMNSPPVIYACLGENVKDYYNFVREKDYKFCDKCKEYLLATLKAKNEVKAGLTEPDFTYEVLHSLKSKIISTNY